MNSRGAIWGLCAVYKYADNFLLNSYQLLDVGFNLQDFVGKLSFGRSNRFGLGMSEKISFVRWLSQVGTRLFTRFNGVLVGTDEFGNSYYRAKKAVKGVREQRWVIYAGEPEASKIPAEWHIWLHHISAEPILANSRFRQTWQKPHQQNMTGTEAAYLPPQHLLNKNRSEPKGVYEAWNPEK